MLRDRLVRRNRRTRCASRAARLGRSRCRTPRLPFPAGWRSRRRTWPGRGRAGPRHRDRRSSGTRWCWSAPWGPWRGTPPTWMRRPIPPTPPGCRASARPATAGRRSSAPISAHRSGPRAQQRRRVDGIALENAFDQLAVLGHAEDLGDRPGGLVRGQTSIARGESAIMPCAASPPSTFCRTRSRHRVGPWQIHREHGGGGIADREAFAVRRDPVAIGNAHARRGAAHANTTSCDQSTALRSGSSR